MPFLLALILINQPLWGTSWLWAIIIYFKLVQSMSCEHFSIIPQPTFLSALTGKVYWVCLYDGCTKTKKGLSKSELCQLCSRFTDEHKVMINCETLEIYCAECKREITDDIDASNKEQTKSKKGKKKDPFNVRELLVSNNNTEGILFAGNAQYPPSFQKQRRGLCGLKANSVSSYLNATVQLLAAIPIMGEMSALTDPSKIDNKFVRGLLTIIETIWTGKFRITSADELERQLQQEDSNFHSYRFKTPQHLLYFIVKKLMEELHYAESSYHPGSPLPLFHEWSNSQEQRHYSFPKELLAGECVLECVCGSCGEKQFAVNRFECLRVSYQRQGQGGQLDLCQLIEQSFNWRNNHAQAIKRIQEGRLQCEKCGERVKEYFAYVRLPNHLVLELGEDQEGLDTSLPDEIDLLPFSEDHVKKRGGASATYHYVGSVYRRDRRFCTHIRHAVNKKQYVICDQLITQGVRSLQQVKLAVYWRNPNPKNQPLMRNIISCLQVNINPVVPLPDYWSLYLKYNHHVQPLANPFICTHGKLKNNLNASKLKNGPQRLPVQVYQYLLETFGGRQIDINSKNCEICDEVQASIAQVRSSEKEMARFADKLSNKKQRVLISRAWLQSWKQFAYDNQKRGYRVFGHMRPGPIKNSTQNIEEDIKSGALKKVSPQVWYFLHKFYGGGPLISKSDIHPNAAVTAAVNLRYDSLEPSLTVLYGEKSSKEAEVVKLRTSAESSHSIQESKEEGKEQKQIV